MSEVRPFGVGSEAVSEVSRFLACEVRPLPMFGRETAKHIKTQLLSCFCVSRKP